MLQKKYRYRSIARITGKSIGDTACDTLFEKYRR